MRQHVLVATRDGATEAIYDADTKTFDCKHPPLCVGCKEEVRKGQPFFSRTVKNKDPNGPLLLEVAHMQPRCVKVPLYPGRSIA